MENRHPVAVTLVESPDHFMRGHPESPERFKHLPEILNGPIAPALLRIAPQPAAEEELLRVHPRHYLQALASAAASGQRLLDYGDTYCTPASYQAARQACGALLQVLDAVLDGRCRGGFALIRPPGHHATDRQAMGFCLLNNIAVAARHVQSHGLQRVFIVDFDVHHGNGTQAIFDPDPQVFYFSTHQRGIFPGSGRLPERGVGEGLGTTANVPLPAGCGDQALGRVFAELLEPLVARFQPHILLVSAGFDGHWRDPLAALQLSSQGYYRLVRKLVELADRYCGGRVVLALEGGYDPLALADSVEQSLHALACLPSPEARIGPSPYAEPQVGALLQQAAGVLLA